MNNPGLPRMLRALASQWTSGLQYSWQGGLTEAARRFVAGGQQAMIESPLIQELLVKQLQESIEDILATRFGLVPQELKKQLRAVEKLKQLKKLLRVAVKCADEEAFRQQLLI
jgi:hypothetical protein